MEKEIQIQLPEQSQPLTITLRHHLLASPWKKSETVKQIGFATVVIPMIASLNSINILEITKDDGNEIFIGEKSHKTQKGWEPDFRIMKSLKELIQLHIIMEVNKENGEDITNITNQINNHELSISTGEVAQEQEVQTTVDDDVPWEIE